MLCSIRLSEQRHNKPKALRRVQIALVASGPIMQSGKCIRDLRRYSLELLWISLKDVGQSNAECGQNI